MSEPLTLVFALYPRITQLDFTGPHELLWRLPGAHCVLASSAGGRIEADGGLGFDTVPLGDLAGCSVLVVPGGYGCVAAMEDATFLHQLRRLAEGADQVVSVCTGSLLLGAAGLLRGRRAACHWAWRELLAEFDGVTPDPARIVRDGNVWSGGGVTAGIDLALALLAERGGAGFAQAVQLAVEYAPAPPFDAGRPETAPPAVIGAVQQRLAAMGAARLEAVRRAAAALRRA
ncbi:MAG: DJ-1/PfpI family protein [Burkholderiales bacterium]|nr:DJ-1/PfpI family protein [Burkholderiales bacterium]MDE2454488.1 DJ-1/PfpI family protein [Burkholderiales bacterium]